MRDKKTKIGIYDPYLFELGGGERYAGIIAEALQNDNEVELISNDSTPLCEIEKRFSINLGNVKKREIEIAAKSSKKRKGNWLGSLINDMHKDKKRAAFTADYDIFINLSNGIPNYSSAKKSILLLQMPYWQKPSCNEPNGGSLKGRIRKALFGSDLTAEEILKLRSYQKKIANSNYTQKWIKRLWNVECDVVYTGLETSKPIDIHKDNLILAVGRFQPDLFCKYQHLLVKAFKDMCDDGLNGWQLFLAGGVSVKKEENDYFNAIAHDSAGYPISLFPNIPFSDLQKLYARSRIFWHATGYGEDEQSAPWKMEHFGLTTVEAMSWGCIPVVINKGGQPEIVSNKVNGMLWNTVDQLKTATREVMGDENLENKLRQEAMRRSKDFDKKIFQRKIRETIAQL